MKIYRFLFLSLSILLAGCQTMMDYKPSFLQNDNDIVNAVKTSFSQNELLSDTTIQVYSEHGVVSLSGYVQKIRQADVAEQLAGQTPGVKSVQNNIIIRK